MPTRSLFSRKVWAVAACCLLLPWMAAAQNKASAIVQTEQVHAELLAYAPEGVGAGKPVQFGLKLTHQPHWHTYWKNPGDSGLPTTLNWTLAAGVTAGDIAWPIPKKIPIGTLANYGYEGTVLLPVPVSISPEFKPPPLGGDLTIKLKAGWLVCRQECIPQEGEFELKIPVQGSTALNRADFQDAALRQPVALNASEHPSNVIHVEGQRLRLTLTTLPATLRGHPLTLFPETPDILHNAATQVAPHTELNNQTASQSWAGNTWTADLPLSDQRSLSPSTLPLVLTRSDAAADEPAVAVRLELPVQGTWPAVAHATEVSPALAAALQANTAQAATPADAGSLMVALLGALLGGMILNFMPCVFPVLTLKVLAFARHADDRRAHRVSGWSYTAGVLVSFLALGMLMLALRSAGEQLGWGFQLQSPAVVAGLGILFTLMGLNLAGLFEFGQVLPSQLAGFRARRPEIDAFLSGMLAVAVASPCTAPFMGASLGLTVGLPAAQALLVFGAVGAGMALPYLAASLIPGVARALPRPGSWMVTLRSFMAFPMFATVVWLIWVLGQQTGIDGAGSLLALLLSMSLLIWTLGLRGRARLGLSALGTAILLWVGSNLGPLIIKPPPADGAAAVSERWLPWSPERLADALAGGKPVFVDYTAAWCVTCQYNKKTTLTHTEVLRDFDSHQVVLLRADWTRRDPAIRQALATLGRSGVPVYALYQTGRAPVVLSEIISRNDVHQALSSLSP